MVLQATLHTHELAALMAAVRYVVESAPAEVPKAAQEQLQSLLDDYNEQLRQLNSTETPRQPEASD